MSSDGRQRWFQWLFRRYVRRRLRRDLDGVFVAGLDAVRARLAQEPLIIAANHVSWWDAMLLIALEEALGGAGFALMDADNLARLPFFRWLGAVPLDRSAPRRSVADLRRAAGLLDRPGRCLWIFPQGEQRPSHLRPLAFQSGVGALARMSQASIVTMSLGYHFRERPVPSAHVAFGAVRGASFDGDLPALLEHDVEHGLERIDRFHLSGHGEFEPLSGARGAPKRVPLGGRMLAMVAGKGGRHG
jgi:1-acyl-sn-glycerol-3-phosphate acyltransferase